MLLGDATNTTSIKKLNLKAELKVVKNCLLKTDNQKII